MTADGARLGRTSTAFALAGAVTVLFSTALAWAKDASPSLTRFMTALAGHNWITHGVADTLLFVGLGLILSRTPWTERIASNRVIGGLVTAVVLSGAGLLIWYAAF